MGEENVGELGGARRALGLRAREWARDISFAGFVFVVTAWGFGSIYSRWSSEESNFRAQYGGGVYAPRMLGREVVYGVHELLTSIGAAKPLALLGFASGEMMGAFSIVNGTAFVLLAVCLRILLRRSLDESSALVAYFVLVAIVGLSFYVVTPYDTLALLATIGCLLLATSGSRYQWWCLPVLALGVMTRESALIAVAVLLPLSFVRRDLVKRSLALTAAGIGATTYISLRVLFDDSGIAEANLLRQNLNDKGSTWFAVVTLGLLAIVWLGLLPDLGLRITDLGQRSASAVRGVWLLASPYWITSLFAGIWFEALRLAVPVLLADASVRVLLAMPHDPQDTDP